MWIPFHVDCLSKQTVSHDLSPLLTKFRGRQNCEIYKNLDLQFHVYATVCVWLRFLDTLLLFRSPLGTFWVLSISVPYIQPCHTWNSDTFFFSVCLLTSLSWLVIVRRVTGLLGLLLSLTEAMCPFLMIGTVASGWPGVWGCGMAWPCPAEEASLEPSVRYCLTCWFWVWWRWNLEFSRWLCTCSGTKLYARTINRQSNYLWHSGVNIFLTALKPRGTRDVHSSCRLNEKTIWFNIEIMASQNFHIISHGANLETCWIL